MQTIFLSPTDVTAPLLLAPQEDVLYVLPEGAPLVSLTLNLRTSGIKVFVVGLFHTEGKQEVTIQQNHLARHTESRVLLKSLVKSGGEFLYQGTVSLTKEASESIASQEARGLLIGEGARFKAVPCLEILPKNVSCTHKASSAPVSPDSLFILTTRGFSEVEAKKILEDAFLRTALDTLRSWQVTEDLLIQIENTLPKNV